MLLITIFLALVEENEDMAKTPGLLPTETRMQCWTWAVGSLSSSRLWRQKDFSAQLPPVTCSLGKGCSQGVCR